MSDQRDPESDRFGILLLLLITSFLMAGFDDLFRVTATVVNAAALVVALRNTNVTRRTTYLVMIATVALIASVVESITDNDNLAGGVSALMQVAILLVMMAAILRRALEHRRVGMQTLFAALCVYFLLGLMFGWGYAAIMAIDDRSVFVASTSTPDPIYYSFVVMTTVGFGDITPATGLVARLTVVEAMAGQVFLATMIARLMSLYGREEQAT